MRRLALGVVLLAVMTTAGDCQKRLPTAPSDLTTGIVVYEHANFQGDSAHITRDVPDLSDVSGPCRHESSGSGPGLTTTYYYDWNDCISSVRVAPGWRATLYRDDDYRDDSIELIADHSNLQLVNHDCPRDGLNDCVTSIRVRPQ